MAEFVAYGKTHRLFRDIIVTEKIDGTNAGLHIELCGDVAFASQTSGPDGHRVLVGSNVYRLNAQSRNRMLTPGKATDNYGFAGWVYDNAAVLVETFGIGLHFGEWWGLGINRAYGLQRRRFSLFNTDKYGHVDREIGGVPVDSVPLLYHGPFRESMIRCALEDLAENGSKAAPGFANPEGVVVFHSQTRTNYKVTLDNQDAGKWETRTP